MANNTKHWRRTAAGILAAAMVLCAVPVTTANLGLNDGVGIVAKADGTLDGLGTEASPYLIQSAADWNTLVSQVDNASNHPDSHTPTNGTANNTATAEGKCGYKPTNGKYYKLTSDIEITQNLLNFAGTFDGDGHTITCKNLADSPFTFVSVATIKNLRVSGTITGTTHVSGLVKKVGLHEFPLETGDGGNLTVNNVSIDATITGTGESKYVAGFVGHALDSTVSITDSVFTGSLITGSATNDTAGVFFGWAHGANITIHNCISAPAALTATHRDILGIFNSASTYTANQAVSASDVVEVYNNGIVNTYTASATGYGGVAGGYNNFTVQQAVSLKSLTLPTAKTLTYAGEGVNQELVNAGSATANDNTSYAINYKVDSGEYGTAVPQASTAGTHNVKYQIGTVEIAIPVTIKEYHPSLSVNTGTGSLIMNFKIPDVQGTAPSVTYNSTAANLTDAGDYSTFQIKSAAKNMDAGGALTIRNANEGAANNALVYENTDTISVEWYMRQLIAGEATYGTANANAARAMLTYGAAAQRFFPETKGAETFVDAGISGTGTVLPAANAVPYKTTDHFKPNSEVAADKKFNGKSLDTNNTCTYSAMNLNLEDDTYIYLFFKLPNTSTEAVAAAKTELEKLRFTGAGHTDAAPVAVKQNSNPHYMEVKVPAIGIKNLGEDITVTKGSTVAYLNAQQYIYSKITKLKDSTDPDDEALVNVCKALMNFYNYAKKL